MAEPSSRPFYSEYAWAFDLLIDRPVTQECGAIAAWLSERGVAPGATLLGTRSELESALVRSGFRAIAYFGAYDPVIQAGATDRPVAVAQVARGSDRGSPDGGDR